MSWNVLATSPQLNRTSYLVFGSNQIISVPETRSIKTTKFQGIHKYDLLNNKWDEFIEYPKNCRINCHTIALNEANCDLYVHCTSTASLKVVNLKSKQFTYHTTPYCSCLGSTNVFINGDYHVFGGLTNTYHLKLNNINKSISFDRLHNFEQQNKYHGIIYAKNTNTLYLFGGNCSSGERDSIWSASFDANDRTWQWEKVNNLTLPKPLSRFGYCYHEQSRNILIFGGSTQSIGNRYTGTKRVYYDNIYVWNIETMSIVTSKIKCPGKLPFQTVILSDPDIDVIVSGFVAQNKCESNIPDEIVSMIKCFAEWADVHLFCTFNRSVTHWKISVFDLIV
eukprot:229589_1